VPADDPQSILLIRPSALGDVCRSVPLVASLRARYPDAAIDWLVQDSFAEAIEHHPDVREAVPFPRHRFSRQLKLGRPGEFARWVLDLRARKYDLAIDAQGLFRSGLFAWWTRAPRRVGYANAPEFAWLGYNERHHVGTNLHSVDRMLTLLEESGVPRVEDMRLHAADEERDWVRAHLPERYTVFAPTSRWIAKQWPDERFAELAHRLTHATDRHVVLVGGPNESEQIPRLTQLAETTERVVDLVGHTRIGRLLAVIEAADLVVANDSAALHMAVGFDRPTVALYGPTRTELVGPYRRESDVIRGPGPVTDEEYDHKNPENHALMDRIGIDSVESACLERLG